MKVPVQVVYDTDTDSLIIRVAAADGDGEVAILSLDLQPLSDDDKRRLRHVRPVEQQQRQPGNTAVTRGGGQ